MAGHAASPLQPGDTIGGFRIVRRIAGGAGSSVYLALDPRTQAPLAVKTLVLPEQDFDADDESDGPRARFLKGAEAAGRLAHPDIVAVYGAGFDRGLAYLAMEALAGTDLTRYVRPARLLPEPLVLHIGARVAEALAHAHSLGVVHRDMKPANVMVSLPARRVTVTDFGIARIADAVRSRSGQLLGTPAFMAPEQLAGAAPDGRSDLYALGVMLFQLLTGRLPYESASLGRLLEALASKPPLTLRAVRPDLPAALGELLARALDKAPQGRPADGREMARALRDIEAGW